MTKDDTFLDDLVREHYASRQPSPERLAGLEDALGPTQGDVPAPRRRLERRAAVGLAACIAVSAAAGAVLALSLRPASPRRPAADIVALQFFAEWCKPSQVVARRVAALQETAADRSVLFVRLDLTDASRREQAELLVTELGYRDVWEAQRGRTGELLLIDARARRPITRLDQDDDTEHMLAALTRALAQVAVP